MGKGEVELEEERNDDDKDDNGQVAASPGNSPFPTLVRIGEISYQQPSKLSYR